MEEWIRERAYVLWLGGLSAQELEELDETGAIPGGAEHGDDAEREAEEE